MQLPRTSEQLRKESGLGADMAKNTIKWLEGVSKWGLETAKDYAKLLGPAVGALTAVALAKALSPRGVAENADNLAINSMEKASLAESLRDYEALKAANKLRKQTRKLHDQFV